MRCSIPWKGQLLHFFLHLEVFFGLLECRSNWLRDTSKASLKSLSFNIITSRVEAELKSWIQEPAGMLKEQASSLAWTQKMEPLHASCLRLSGRRDKNTGHMKGLIYKMFPRAAGERNWNPHCKCCHSSCVKKKKKNAVSSPKWPSAKYKNIL